MLIDVVGHFEKSLLFVLRDEQMDMNINRWHNRLKSSAQIILSSRITDI